MIFPVFRQGTRTAEIEAIAGDSNGFVSNGRTNRQSILTNRIFIVFCKAYAPKVDRNFSNFFRTVFCISTGADVIALKTESNC